MKLFRRAFPRFALLSVLAVWLLTAGDTAQAQGTAFTYQGKLSDAGQPANGTYDLQFRLFDTLVSGNQVGATLVREDVSVSNGIFTVSLDFGAVAFPGANRFLEIGVRPSASTGAFTPLAPLQPVTATPYAIRSLNATNADSAVTAMNATNATNATNAVNATNATSADTLSVGCVGCVNGAKLADGSVSNAKITDVAGSKLTVSITTATIPGANVTGTVANATNATNATTATNATNATTSVNFNGTLAGDVTGNQGTTSVVRLRNLPLPTPVQADDGKVLRYKNDGVNPASYELASVTGGGGTITGVTAGTGLSGGGTNGNVTVGLVASGVTATELATNAVTTPKLADASVTDAKISAVAGSKITGAIPVAGVPAGSASYIQNTTTQQLSSNFNISGNGTLGGTLAASNVGIGTPTPGSPLDLVGAFSVRGATAPPVAPPGQGRLYFDAALNKFRISQNGGTYSDLFGSGSGVTGSGTTNTIPLWNGNTTLSDSVITQASGNISIGDPLSSNGPVAKFLVSGPLASPNIETMEIMRLARPGPSGIKNTNTAGFAVGSFEPGILGQARLDIRLSGLPTNSNVFGTIPDVTVMSLLANGNVGIGKDIPSSKLHLSSNDVASTTLVLENLSGIPMTTRRIFLSNYGSTGAGNYWPGLDSANTSSLLAPNLFVLRSTGGLAFSGSSTAEHLRISTDGNVAIGTSPGSNRLTINHTVPNAFATYIKNNGIQAGSSYGLLIEAGTDVTDSALQVNSQSGIPFMRVRGNGYVGIGTTNPQAKLEVAGTARTYVLQITGGMDLAEQFEINAPLNTASRMGPEKIKPGMVVSIDAAHPGKLVVSHQAYDRKVAGIISGAGGIQPGMLMGQTGFIAEGDQPVALTGRVYCWADATNKPIRPGDLLTTSNSAGHAMKVTNHKKSQGAILGKAMTGLKRGRGLVLVLVTLQ